MRRAPFQFLRILAFFCLCLASVWLPLAPLAPGADRIAPDMLYCVAVAWILRDPDTAPVYVLLPVAFLADILFSRPPALGALALLFATEFARDHRDAMRGPNMLVEWLTAALLFAAMWGGQLLVLRLSFSDGPASEVALVFLIETAVYYPVVSLVIAFGMRVFGGGAGREGARAW